MKGMWAGGEQGAWFLKDSFAFLFMAKNMKMWRWQEENAVEVEELGVKQDEWMEKTERVQRHMGRV